MYMFMNDDTATEHRLQACVPNKTLEIRFCLVFVRLLLAELCRHKFSEMSRMSVYITNRRLLKRDKKIRKRRSVYVYYMLM